MARGAVYPQPLSISSLVAAPMTPCYNRGLPWPAANSSMDKDTVSHTPIGKWWQRHYGRRVSLHPSVLPLLVLCALAALLMWRSVVGGIFLPLDIVPHQHPWRFSYERVPVNNPTNSDLIQQVYPRRLLTRSIVSQSAWPLWNPTILTGTPLLADGQTTFFYPPSLLFLVLPLAQAFGVYALLQLILAAAGSYFFTRRLELERGPATLAAMCYMFSGYLLTWLQFPHHSGAMAMLPWCFWAVERALTRNAWSGWLLAGALLALPLLSHIQLSVYIYVGVGWYVLARLCEAQPWGVRARRVAGFTLAVGLALALSAVQLIPQIALSAEGQRADQETTAYTAATQFVQMLRLGLPLIGGEARMEPPSWGAPLLAAPQPYTGLAPLLLALLALLMSRRSASTIFGLLAIGSFALALRTPLLQLFITLVPPYRQFTDHDRWFALWGFAIAILAGLGAQVYVDRGRELPSSMRRIQVSNRVVLAIVALGVVVAAWQHLALFTPQSRYGEYITLIRQQPFGMALLFAGLSLAALLMLAMRRVPRSIRWSFVVAVVAGDLLWYGGSYNTTTDRSIFQPTTDLTAALTQEAPRSQNSQVLYPPTRQISFLQAQQKPFRFLAGDYPALQPNLATAYELEDVRGYQSLYLARYNRLTHLIDGKDYRQLAAEAGSSLRPYFTTAYTHRRLLDMLNVEFILFPPGSKNPPLYAPLNLVQENDEGQIYRNPQVLPRAWLVHQVETIPDDTAQLDRLARADFDPAALAIVPEAIPPLGRPSPADKVEPPTYTPNTARVRASVGEPALLVLSDAYTDDWSVTVDGTPATLYRTNYVLRGVWLPQGTHELVFTYRPRSFVLGAGISLAALGICVVLVIWQRMRRDHSRFLL